MTDEEMAMLIIGRLTFRLEKLAREYATLKSAAAKPSPLDGVGHPDARYVPQEKPA